MLWQQSLILGIIQGLTEFLPISSSGHLVIVPEIFKWPEQPLVFDVILHMGTAFALIIYFFKDLKDISLALVKDFFKYNLEFNSYSSVSKLAFYIILASIPAAFLGLKYDTYIEAEFRSISSSIIFLILGTAIMLFAEVLYVASQNSKYTYKNTFVIGLFQSLALLPGVSRSGVSISGGMLVGLSREQAARFSFLLSIPIVFAAAIFKILSSFSELANFGIQNALIGFFASFISGLLAISFLIRYLKNNDLNVFILYRIILIGFLVYYYV